MTSTVAICNLALSNLGKDNISALTEASAEARACNQFYDHVRKLLLQEYPWGFAGKSASLASITNDKEGDWLYAYRKPNDCLKLRTVRNRYSTTPQDDLPEALPSGFPYEVEGSAIYCDLSPAFGRYTYDLTDPTKFSVSFIEALGWHLSVRLAMPLTRDPKVRADAYQIAIGAQHIAEMADANEVRHTSDHDSEFVTERS
jgi:hypothetical protein